MNRRRFLEILTQATIGATVAYSFPNIIVPRNISFTTIEETYRLTCLGKAEPSYIVANNRAEQFIFDLIDHDLKEAMAIAERHMNLRFFGAPVTFEEVRNSHV